jgi:hypothetical protein
MEKSYTNSYKPKKNKRGNLFDFVGVAELLIMMVVMGFLAYTILGAFSSKVAVYDTVETNYSSFVDTTSDRMSISNVFGAMMDKPDIALYVTGNLPMVKFFLQYFPFVTLVYIAIVMVVFFGKDETGI